MCEVFCIDMFISLSYIGKSEVVVVVVFNRLHGSSLFDPLRTYQTINMYF